MREDVVRRGGGGRRRPHTYTNADPNPNPLAPGPRPPSPAIGKRTPSLPHDGRAVGAALDENADPIKAANLALKVIETADPGDSATLTVSTTEDIENMSLSELLAFADAHGIDYTRRPGETPPEIPPAALPAGS